jgi:hypothetical protein
VGRARTCDFILRLHLSEIASPGMSAADPFFCVVMHHQRKWTIEATWPDKSVELVETFADYFEALRWLGQEASAWVEKRLVSELVKAAS